MTKPAAKLKVGLVSPYSWTSVWGVNRHIAGLGAALSAGGHDVSIIVPAEERNGARAARKRARAAKRTGMPSNGLQGARRSTDGQPWNGQRLLGISGTFRVPYSEHLANLTLPLEVTEQLDDLLTRENFDILHVHEPYPPSLSFTSLRLAQSPVVASFHTGGERFLSYQLMRPVVERFFGRLDGRVCTSQNTRRIVSSHFPGDYEVIGSGVDTGLFTPGPGNPAQRPLVVFAAWSNPRKGLALLTRTVRLLPEDVPPFDLAVAGGEELTWRQSLIIPRRLRSRISLIAPAGSPGLVDIYRRAELLLAPYATSGQASAVLEAMACATPAFVPGQGGLKELVSEGSEGLLLDHPYAYNLAAGLMDLLSDEGSRRSMGAAAARKAARHSWIKTGSRMSKVYSGAHRRRRRPAPPHAAIESNHGNKTILADLHMHTSFSSDCRTAPEELLAACEESGLAAIAVTDHNTIEGAVATASMAPPGLMVIVGEEIKTSEGEIIGLYLSEEIPRGLSPEETIRHIKRQGGLVYVPHPFDPLHKTPSYETLARNAADIDIIEVYNPRIAFASFNEKARRLARKYGIPGAAGSDCHVAAGVGTAMISLRPFNGPQELLLSLREADIIRSRVSPIYLHSLKLLKSGRGAAT
ncbi:MAG: glycosyltransferase [Thermoleophilia bacterium]|nr:glycosyltransferase [Thermoleophilia bacterium]